MHQRNYVRQPEVRNKSYSETRHTRFIFISQSHALHFLLLLSSKSQLPLSETIIKRTNRFGQNLKFPMSISEKQASSSIIAARDVDPLLRDLNDKKQSFRRNVVSLASELKELRSRLASQEQSYVKETQTRQEAETNAKIMELEISKLQKKLEEKNEQLQASTSSAQKHIKELDDLRTQLVVTKATADSSAASAQSAHFQCLELQKELDEKNSSLREHEERVVRLSEQLDNLQKDLQAREFSQKQLRDEVFRIERDIMEALAKAGENKDCELRKILDEVSPKNVEKMNKLLVIKDDEIVKLKDEMKIMSAHWKHKTKELESQLEKQRRADQDLKKRVLKLEFCLQEARSQTRKLQRMGERRDKAIKELRDQLAGKQQKVVDAEKQNQNFWDSSGFKIVVSMSMLVLVVFSKR
ncbi:myosin heavy chain, cardiac protein [Trifolium repens]|nr:myosin heavy chain, cardiac protein [Trifolium repens]